MSAVYGSQSHRAADRTLREVLVRVAAEPARLGAILDEYATPLIAFTAMRKVLAANPAAERFFGHGRHQLDGAQTDLIVPERFRQPEAPPQAATPDLTTVELPGLRADGVEIPTVWTFGHAPTAEGPVFVLLVCDRTQLEHEFDALEHRGRELEHRFRAVYENALDGIMLLDDAMRVIDLNPAGSRLLQRPRGELVGMSSFDLVTPAQRPTDDRVGAFRDTGAMTGETVLVLPGGGSRRVEFGAVADVSPGMHMTIFRDIEDRKRAEEAQAFLDQASRLFSASQELDETLGRIPRLAVPRIADWAAVDMVANDGTLRRVALAHADPAKIAIAQELWKQGTPTLADAAGLGAVVRTGRPELVETIDDDHLFARMSHDPDLLARVRQIGLVSRMVVPVQARGKTVGALTFGSAESKRRFSPADLTFAEELARRASYAIENALIVHELRIANATKDTFLQRAEHLQATAMQLVRADSVEAIARAFEAAHPTSPVGAHGWTLYIQTEDRLELLAATEGLRTAARQWRVLPLAGATPMSEAARTGAPVWVRDRDDLLERYPIENPEALSRDLGGRAAIPLVTGDGCIGALGVIFPTSHLFDADERAYLVAVANLWGQALQRARLAEAEREAIRRALEAETLATRKKDEFLAMLGHELRNPLAPISTATSLIRMRGRATDRELGILERQSRHLVRLVDDLLDISRITSGKLTLQRGPVDMREVVRQAVESTLPSFKEKQIQLELDTSEEGLLVDGDRDRLVQVVTNVLVNAAKFTPSGKKVHLGSHRDGTDVVIEVRDEGQGIDADLLPQVFDLFSQGKQGTDRRSGGLGLGLAIARSIVQAHEGQIQVASPGPNRGTSVIMRLARLESKAAGVTQEGAAPTPIGALGRPRVLIVDDNQDSADLLSAFLEDIGYECFVAADAARAMSIVREVPLDIAILDIGLPEIDGYQLARSVRAALADRAPKLIALTGYAQGSDRARALESGFAEHMAKPVDVTTLAAKLRRLLAVSGGAGEGHVPPG